MSQEYRIVRHQIPVKCRTNILAQKNLEITRILIKPMRSPPDQDAPTAYASDQNAGHASALVGHGG